jgi:ribosomal protein L30E
MKKTENLSGEIRKKIKENKIVIGLSSTKKNLLNKNLEKVIIAKNCPENLKEEFEKYCKITGTEIEITEMNNEELGILCKKQYPASFLGVLK